MSKIIPDQELHHVWFDKVSGEEITVTPDWYQQNGTPITAETGEDMEYLRTEWVKEFDEITPEDQVIDLINQNAELIKIQNKLGTALKWFLENDDTNDIPENHFWIEGYEQGREAVATLDGVPYKREEWCIDES